MLHYKDMTYVWRQLEDLGWALMDKETDWVNTEYEVGDKQ